MPPNEERQSAATVSEFNISTVRLAVALIFSLYALALAAEVSKTR